MDKVVSAKTFFFLVVTLGGGHACFAISCVLLDSNCLLVLARIALGLGRCGDL
jgi:hypothetical protein